MKCVRGYTLIEILIVIVLISIIGTFAALSVGYNSNKRYEALGKKIIHRMALAQQEAMLRPAVIAFAIRSNSFEFYLLDEKNKSWHAMNESLLEKYNFSSEIVINATNQKIIFLPSGNISSFKLFIGGKNQSPQYFITGKSNGDISSGWLHEK